MDCNHITIDGRICDLCGLIIYPFQLIQGWPQLLTKQIYFPSKTNLNKELIKYGIPYEYLKLIPNILDNITKKTKLKIKGKRKKAIVFAILFDLERKDPDELRQKLNLSRDQCIRGLKTYESCIKFLNWNWKSFLKIKLKKLNLVNFFDEIKNNIIQFNSNYIISDLIYLNILNCLEKYNMDFDLTRLKKEFSINKKFL